jgi:hypothetical protein
VDNHVQAQFKALLLEPVLEPLASAFGEYGDMAIDQFAQALAKELSP